MNGCPRKEWIAGCICWNSCWRAVRLRCAGPCINDEARYPRLIHSQSPTHEGQPLRVARSHLRRDLAEEASCTWWDWRRGWRKPGTKSCALWRLTHGWTSLHRSWRNSGRCIGSNIPTRTTIVDPEVSARFWHAATSGGSDACLPTFSDVIRINKQTLEDGFGPSGCRGPRESRLSPRFISPAP